MRQPPFELFPAVDIRDGQCVRLKQGRDADKTVYFADPLEPARLFQAAGARWVHVVDLDGAFGGAPKNLETVGRMAALGVAVQFGGGLRSAEALAAAFAAGVSRAVIGTRAMNDPGFLLELAAEWGARIALGVDAKDGRVALHGWVHTTDVEAVDFAVDLACRGVQTLIYTDIATDGMLRGPNLEAQRTMARELPPGTRLIASGGVGRLDDVRALRELARECPVLSGAIVGRALYEGKVDLREALQVAGGEGQGEGKV